MNKFSSALITVFVAALSLSGCFSSSPIGSSGSGELDESKAKETLQRWLDAKIRRGDFPPGKILSFGPVIDGEAHFKVQFIEQRTGESVEADRTAKFKRAQDRKWYLTEVGLGIAGAQTVSPPEEFE
jgi:hypothetical protein